MLNSRPRRLAALVLLAFATMVAAPSAGHAATIKACQNKKNGKLRIAKKCKKSEKKISWNTNGPKGDKGDGGANGAAGANGTNGTNGAPGTPGAPGQPQAIRSFAASQAGQGNEDQNTNVPLFTADGVSYSFHCQFALILNIASLRADAPSGSAYSQGTLGRPNEADRQDADPWSATRLTTLGGGAKDIAAHSTLSNSNGTTQNGVYTTVVEGPTATTLLHFKMVAAGPCTIQGVALTIPNS